MPDSFRCRVKRLRHKVETVTSEVELESRLKKAEELLNQNDDEGRQFLASFELAPPEMPSDPFSPEYHDAQIRPLPENLAAG